MLDTITVDTHFVSNILTVALQMEGRLGIEQKVDVRHMEIDTDTGNLVLDVEIEEVTIN